MGGETVRFLCKRSSTEEVDNDMARPLHNNNNSSYNNNNDDNNNKNNNMGGDRLHRDLTGHLQEK